MYHHAYHAGAEISARTVRIAGHAAFAGTGGELLPAARKLCKSRSSAQRLTAANAIPKDGMSMV